VVATPIGNLRDITLRALEVLASVDIIAAEDTRNTAHLLSHHSISTKLVALHEHNERVAAARLVDSLLQGKSVALVSDAGTPAISDPGTLLVRLARQSGLRVVPVPGPSAVISAISAAGVDAPHFLFYGFLPHKSTLRRRELEALKLLPYLLVFYEAPHRILDCVADLASVLGSGRTITFARELTKLFETVYTCSLGEAGPWLSAYPDQQRGEFVLLVSGAEPVADAGSGEQLMQTLTVLLGELPLKQAVKLAAQLTGEKRNKVYETALALKGGAE
jgi:16S rRNA (cytidine1402-2'-O)-methyltransferase